MEEGMRLEQELGKGFARGKHAHEAAKGEIGAEKLEQGKCMIV